MKRNITLAFPIYSDLSPSYTIKCQKMSEDVDSLYIFDTKLIHSLINDSNKQYKVKRTHLSVLRANDLVL